MRRIVAVRDLKERMGWPWTLAQTWRMIAAGKLPPPFFLKGSRLGLFFEDEIRAYLDAAPTERKAKALHQILGISKRELEKMICKLEAETVESGATPAEASYAKELRALLMQRIG